MTKLTVIGAGNVGATVADCVARKDIVNEVVLIDIVEGLPQGKALDMQESAPVHGFDTRIAGTNAYEETAGSDICVITAGRPRTADMSRDDLLELNANIVRSVTERFAADSPDAIIIVVSNPLDAMTSVAHAASGFPTRRVMGMAGILDTARYRTFIALELGVSVRDVQALLLGGHGDSMVPLPSCTTVGGIPLPGLLPREKIHAIVERTKGGGGEISRLMGASAWYAPGASAAAMVESVMKNLFRVLPCAVQPSGQYGLADLFIGLPARLGRNGVEDILEVGLSDEEQALLDASAEHVRRNLDVLRQKGFM